jgi:2-phospho-L-lactate guanylyltransferase
MRTIAVLPVKSFPAAKRRLSRRLGPKPRQALARAMLLDVLGALRRVRGLAAIAVVTADAAAAAAATEDNVIAIADPAEAGQSAAAELGIDYARSAGFERVLLVPADTPLLSPSAVEDLLRRSAADDLALAIVGDRHGTGTNALLIAPPGAFPPSFGPGSLERHLRAARRAGLPHRVESAPSLELDVDAPGDLAELETRLAKRPGAAPRTAAALGRLTTSPSIAQGPPEPAANR